MATPGGDLTATVRASVQLEPLGAPLSPTVEPKLIRVVVDTHLHLPDMFELTFLDEDGSVVDDANLKIGTELSISGGAPDSMSTEKLITGEVTSIEADCRDLVIYSIVRGYDKAHRLQRARRTRTFVNMTDSAIASKVAHDASLSVGTIDETNVSYDHVSQIAQTDWDFLKLRAREIGFEVGVTQGKFFFRKASGNTEMASGSLGGALAAAASSVGDMLGIGSTTLTFKGNLLTFRPRVTAAGLTPEVEVRVWDPQAGEVVVGKHASKTGSASLHDNPADLADQFGKGFLGLPIPIPPIPGLPSLGPQASTKAVVITNRPVASGDSTHDAVDAVALGVAEHVASTFAEAEGEAIGDPGIQASKAVEIKGVPKAFEGTWIVTNSRHIFDDEEGGYRTRFFVSGRHDRSLLGLASGGASPPAALSPLRGIVIGLVTNNNDPKQLGRVKVAFPWLAGDYESDWARVCQYAAGKTYGAVFLPEVGDEVLVGFEFDDVRRPYVLGGLINGKAQTALTSDVIKSMGLVTQVVKSGFVSHAGHKLLFDDDALPTGSTSGITLGTKDDKLVVKIDQANGQIHLLCDPAPPTSSSPTGTVTIETGAAGTINVKTGAGGTINVEAGTSLNLKANASVKIESTGPVEIKGNPIKLN